MGLRHELKRTKKKVKDTFDHVTHGDIFTKKGLRETFRDAFGEHSGKRLWNWITNPARAAQRSHRFGHSWAPSWSDKNIITQAYNKVMNSFSSAAMRAAQRQVADQVGNSGYTASQSAYASMSPNVTQHLDYSYRRLSDIS